MTARQGDLGLVARGVRLCDKGAATLIMLSERRLPQKQEAAR